MIYTLQNVRKQTLQGELLDELFDVTFLSLTTEARDMTTLLIIETDQKTGFSYLLNKFFIEKDDINRYMYEPLVRPRLICNIRERRLSYYHVKPGYEAENQKVFETRGFICNTEVFEYRLNVDLTNPLRVYHDTQFECWGFQYLYKKAIENSIYTDKLSKAKDDDLSRLVNDLPYDNRIYLNAIIGLLGEQQRYVSYEIE